jgi:hypothetical protein
MALKGFVNMHSSLLLLSAKEITTPGISSLSRKRFLTTLFSGAKARAEECA